MTEQITSLALPSHLAGLVRLSHHRWMVPLIAEVGKAGGARVAVLRARMGVNGPSLSRTIAAACEANLLMPNPGYGHPLRPEYLLTPWGEGITRECQAVVKIAQSHSWTEMIARKWSLPVLAAVAAGCHHYSEIAQALPVSTPRAISMALNDLIQAGCLSRNLRDGRPPRSLYAIDPAGRGLAKAILGFAAAANFG